MMTTDLARIRDELALFADLGTAPPQYSFDGTRAMVRMIRKGEPLEILFEKHDKIIERSVDSHEVRPHASYRALLASTNFGDLGTWAYHQSQSLRELKSAYDVRIPVTGVLTDCDEARELDVGEFDQYLACRQLLDQPSARVMLIDGPAGIGKTRFIEFLALLRAQRFTRTQDPLVLHVQSRGRVLTYLSDLIAFSLQRLRLSVTFDQVPVLVRHGLVTLAIDGFDELADPNGYDLAWGQLGELIDQVRERGTLILAGRETFIGQERIRMSITSLKQHDDVQSLTLQPPLPDTAKRWLRERLQERQPPNAPEFPDELFESGSFALRPFFLVQLSRLLPARSFGSPQPGILLASLIDAMIEREAGKFGDAVMTEKQRHEYVRRFLREVARFMADDQTESIDELGLEWISEMAAPEEISADTLGVLKNRASAVACLENDDTPRHRRFSHSILFNHFLGEDVLDAVARGDVPKYVRRNILGAEFLSTFSDLTVHVALLEPERVFAFFESASTMAQAYARSDRGARNLGAFLIAMLPSMGEMEPRILHNFHADEALMRGTTPPARIQKVVINQLDIQGTNVESLEFFDSHIVTLAVDDATVVSPSIPIPARIQYNRSNADRSRVISEDRDKENWLATHGRIAEASDGVSEERSLIPKELRDHPLRKLLGRACRSRSFWIPEGSTNYFEKFTRDPSWPDVLELLKEHSLVRVEEIAAAGTNSRFFHIKQPMRILSEDVRDENVKSFYEAFVMKLRKSTVGR